jgi:hypothetical protein
MASGLCDTPLLAVNSRISEIEKEIEESKKEFDGVHKDGKLDNQPEFTRLSELEPRRQVLMKARRYILGRLSLSDSGPVLMEQNH